MKALISGILGQDGSYLSELLLSKGYEVHGIYRRVASRSRFDFHGQVVLHEGSLESYASLFSVVEKVRPDECYHLASQSFVGYSFEDPFSTLDVNVNGTSFMLESIRLLVPKCRFYFAGSSEMFGNAYESPQTEETPFKPRSPYGISKVTGCHLTRLYREAYGLHASVGILFNHESPRRGPEFVTSKVTDAAARVKRGEKVRLWLGNLDARRDWGYAPDYVEAMWLMLQQPEPDDYVVATGETHSVRDLLDVAFDGLPWQNCVTLDRSLLRPADIHELKGDASKARRMLGWKPTVTFEEMIRLMVRGGSNA